MSIDVTKLPENLRGALTAELQPGERVLYAGRPDWRAEHGTLISIFLFGNIWTALCGTVFASVTLALFGLTEFKYNGEPADWHVTLFFWLFLLLFVVIGLLILAAPFLAIAKSRGAVHAVTDTRLLNVFIAYDKGCDSHLLQTVNFIQRRDRRNGTGSLSIGYGTRRDSDGDVQSLTLDWSGIPDVKRAEAAIRENARWAR